MHNRMCSFFRRYDHAKDLIVGSRGVENQTSHQRYFESLDILDAE